MQGARIAVRYGCFYSRLRSFKMRAKPTPEEDAMFDALSSDFDKCVDQIENEDSQFWRRTLCRTIFAMFEAANGLLKEKALEAICSADKKSWNATRIGLLGDHDWRIAKNGTLEMHPLRRPFLNYTAFVLRSLAEESYTEPVFFSDDGWNQFQKAVEIRHRLTHPKKNTDMNISDEEMRTLYEAVRWYYNAAHTAIANKAFWTTAPEVPPQKVPPPKLPPR